ncbi:unnamed protein product [Brugia timori]|nr:unnamed protein product [Brugia timori]
MNSRPRSRFGATRGTVADERVRIWKKNKSDRKWIWK